MAEATSPAVLPVRLFVGWIFLHASLQKLAEGWLIQPKVAPILEGWLREGKTYKIYAPFLRNVVLPHAQTWSIAVAGGELLVGAALLAGLFTRVAAFGALLLSSAFLLANGDGIAANATAPIVVMSLALMFSHSGRVLGLDAAMSDRLPRWLT